MHLRLIAVELLCVILGVVFTEEMLKKYVLSYAVAITGLAFNLIPGITDEQKQTITIVALVLAGLSAMVRYIYDQRKLIQAATKESEEKDKTIQRLKKANKQLKEDMNVVSAGAQETQRQFIDVRQHLLMWYRHLDLLMASNPNATLADLKSLAEDGLESRLRKLPEHLNGGDDDG